MAKKSKNSRAQRVEHPFNPMVELGHLGLYKRYVNTRLVHFAYVELIEFTEKYEYIFRFVYDDKPDFKIHALKYPMASWEDDEGNKIFETLEKFDG